MCVWEGGSTGDLVKQEVLPGDPTGLLLPEPVRRGPALYAAAVVACTRWIRKSGRRGGGSGGSSNLRCRGRRLRETARYCGKRAG